METGNEAGPQPRSQAPLPRVVCTLEKKTCFSNVQGKEVETGNVRMRLADTSSNVDLTVRKSTILSEDIAGGFWR